MMPRALCVACYLLLVVGLGLSGLGRQGLALFSMFAGAACAVLATRYEQ